MRLSSSRSDLPRTRRRLVPAGLLLALAFLTSACGSTATVTVSGGQPTATTAATTTGLPTATTSSGGPTATPTNTPITAPPPSPTAFVWTANPGNIQGDYTIIENPTTDNNPDAILIVTPRWPPNNVYDDHAIGVWYYSGHWTIFHQDTTAIPSGASYNVKVFSSGSGGVFQWTASAATITGNYTKLTGAIIPDGASARLLVTPVYTSSDIYDNHPIGTWWNGSVWTIFNQKASVAATAPMPVNAVFNVAEVSGFTQVATSANSAGDTTSITGNSSTDGHPNAVLECTPRWDTTTQVYVNHNIGVYYTGGHWAIFTQDRTTMPGNATFNCEVYGS
jgi:hypothetical protein